MKLGIASLITPLDGCDQDHAFELEGTEDTVGEGAISHIRLRSHRTRQEESELYEDGEEETEPRREARRRIQARRVNYI